MSQFTLALDVGTHSVRAALVDAKTLEVKVKQQKNISVVRKGPGMVEQDAEEIFHALTSVIDKTLAETDLPPKSAVMACQRSSVVAWQRDTGSPIGPVLSWQDTRAQSVLQQIELDRQVIYELSGLVSSPHYGASKMHWIIQQWDLSTQQHCLAPLASFLIFRLLENSPYLCDASIAARTLLLNWRTGCWDEQLLAAFGIDGNLLPCVTPIRANYGLLKHYKIPLTAVAGDQNAAFLAHFVEDGVQRIHVNLGSGAFALKQIQNSDDIDCELLTSLIFSDEQRNIIVQEGTVNGAGLALSRFCEQPALADLGGEDYILQKLPVWLNEVDQNFGWVYINCFGGLGSPFWRADVRSKFIALAGAGAKQPNISQSAVAIIESMVFLICINCQRLQKNHSAKEIIISGGLSRLSGLCQRLADITLRPVLRVSDYEATLIGAARMADGLNVTPELSMDKEFQPQLNPGLGRRFEFFSERLQELLRANENA